MMRVRAAGLGAAVSVAACFAFAPTASADPPVVLKNATVAECLVLVNTPGVAGHVPGTLRLPPPPGAPEIIFICAGPGF